MAESNHAFRPRGTPLRVDVLQRLEAFVALHGEREAVNRIGISLNSLYRALARAGLHRGTITQIEIATELDEIERATGAKTKSAGGRR